MKIWLSPGLQMTNAKKQPYFTQKHCFRAKFFTIYSSFLWISHIFIHSIIHSIVWWKIFIQRAYSFIKKRKLFIQWIYSFKTIQIYSFKENIHSSENLIIAQGYTILLQKPNYRRHLEWAPYKARSVQYSDWRSGPYLKIGIFQCLSSKAYICISTLGTSSIFLSTFEYLLKYRYVMLALVYIP